MNQQESNGAQGKWPHDKYELYFNDKGQGHDGSGRDKPYNGQRFGKTSSGYAGGGNRKKTGYRN